RDFHVTGVQTCALPICPTGRLRLAHPPGNETPGHASWAWSEVLVLVVFGSVGGVCLLHLGDLALVRLARQLDGVVGGGVGVGARSEERRVGKEGRVRGW